MSTDPWPSLVALARTAREVEQLLQANSPFWDAIQSAQKGVALYEAMVETERLERELLPQIAAHGWLISPMAPANEPATLHYLLTKGGIEAVEEHLLAELDDETCEAIISELTSRPSFTAWAPTFRKALAAHVRGEFELAIPIWLAALDGISEEEVGARIFSLKSVKKKRTRVRGKLPAGRVYGRITDAWINVLTGFSERPRPGGPALLNRNAVMHGERPEIGTRRDSVQCILALQTLHYLLTAPERKAGR